MAITARTLTGILTDVQGVPKGARFQQAWIGSSKATIVDAPSTIRVGKVVPLALSGDGAFTALLPDSAQAGVLYSLWATWVEPAGARRQTGPTMLGTFHLTADAQIGAVLETSDGQIPPSLVDQLRDEIAAVLPPGGGVGQILGKASAADGDVTWVDQAPGGGGGGGDVSGKLDKTTAADRVYATDSAGEQTTLQAATLGRVVEHGATASTARPVGATVVHWRGTVYPSNATTGDLYLNPATSTIQLKTAAGWQITSLPEPGTAGHVLTVVDGAWTAAEPTGGGGVSSWDDLADKPAVIAAGDNPSEARAAIGAGTSSLTLGDTDETAKPGNWVPAIADVTDLTGTLDGLADDIDTRAPQTGTAIAVPWDSALETWPAVDTDPTLIRHYHSPGDPAAEAPVGHSPHDLWFAHPEAP